MIHIAIVEDTEFDRQVLKSCLEEYARETGTELSVSEFSGGQDFLDHCPEQLDLVLLDIVMGDLDGLTTARLFRRRDEKTLLVFVTSMVQYAVQGYSVDAMDFLVKPVSYTGVKLCMDRVVRRLSLSGSARLSFSNREGTFALPVSDICYFESLEHRVIVHTVDQALPVDTSLAAVEKMVSSLPFFRCHVSYLVHLRYVDRISGNDIWVNGNLLSISRYRRREFLEAWAAWQS